MSDAEILLRDALTVPFEGWDFSVLGDRITMEPPAWSFDDIVDAAASAAEAMLDMGTGGGEFLSARRLAATTVATEAWAPNVPVAAARLAPLGVFVVHYEGAPDNADQVDGEGPGLPFRTAAFDLVMNRHEAFLATEVRRVLQGGGRFVTQQADSGGRHFSALLDAPPPPAVELRLDVVVDQVERAGLRVVDAAEGSAAAVFADIGALAWYLTNVPWAVPDFSIERYRTRLLRLHGAPIRVPAERFWLAAVNPT